MFIFKNQKKNKKKQQFKKTEIFFNLNKLKYYTNKLSIKSKNKINAKSTHFYNRLLISFFTELL